MKGTIRFFLGLLITFGAVGADDAAPIWAVLATATVGLALMYWAIRDLDKQSRSKYN